MNGIDLAQIEKLLARVIDEKLSEASTRFDTKVETIATTIDGKLSEVSARLDTNVETIVLDIDQKLNRFKSEIFEEFAHQIKLQTEDFQQGLSVVAEGHQMLSDKLDRVEARLDDKLESISAKLSAHRTDTEAHGGIYLVKES